MSTNTFRDARTGITIEVRQEEVSLQGLGGSSYQYTGHKMIRVIDEFDGTETQWFDAAEVQGFDQQQMMDFCRHKLMETKSMQERFNHQYLGDPYKAGDELRTPEFEFETIQQPDGSWIKRARPRKSLREDEAIKAREAAWVEGQQAKKLAEMNEWAKQQDEKRRIEEAMLKEQQRIKAKAELERIELDALREDQPDFGAFS